MERIQRLLQQAGGMGGGNSGPAVDQETHDTSEQILLSSLALLKVYTFPYPSQTYSYFNV
jgi:hypothetical protein